MKKKVSNMKDFKSYIEDRLSHTDLEETKNEKLDVIRTGSVSLDISTGIGGIPKKKTVEIYGSESSGKTTLALSICNEAIKSGNKVLYIDAENTLDLDWTYKIIKDHSEDKFILIQPHVMEDSLFVAEEGINSEEFGLIILDSIGALAPQKVLDDKLTDANVALLARMMTIFIQRNAYMIRKNNVAFVGINQVRDRIGSYFGGFETPGGHAWKHNCSLRIFLSKMADIKQGEDIIGISTKFLIKKNKLAPPLRTYTFPILFDRGLDIIRDIVDFAEMMGVLTKGGSYYLFEGNTIGQGLSKTIQYLDENRGTIDKIKEMCYNKADVMNILIEEEKGLLEEDE